MPDVDYDDYHADDAGLRCRSRQGRGAGERRLRVNVNDHHDDAQHFHDDSEHELDYHDHGSRDHDDVRILGRSARVGVQAGSGGKG